MVSNQSVQEQLKKIGFNTSRWNRPECRELAAIILPDEKIFECVNGWYEGGVALLCATDIRILLVDKKPLRFLTVEDLRFDTINQIDYSHRLMDAHVNISAGMKSLTFRSYNKPRLRKLIGHVQHRMAEIKKYGLNESQDQKNHLNQIDRQLQTYVMAQYQQHESLRRMADKTDVESLEQFNRAPIISNNSQVFEDPRDSFNYRQSTPKIDRSSSLIESSLFGSTGVTREELYNEGLKEILAKRAKLATSSVDDSRIKQSVIKDNVLDNGHEISPLRIAYSQLVNINRRRKDTGKVRIR
jgi:hypothetical protein